MWVSAPMQAGAPEFVEARFDAPAEIHEVRLVFDDDVDVELNTLHHHRTPERVFPQLVRDYAIEVLRTGTWSVAVKVEGNRRRHRVHAVSGVVDAVRVRVDATNGDVLARIVSLRVY